MSNRSYLYSMEKMPGEGGRVVGLSECAACIPLVYRILVSVNPASTGSILFGGGEVRGITADYEGGVRRLEEFFGMLPEAWGEKAADVLEFLRDERNAQKFIHLECAEIFEMEDEGDDDEDGFFARKNDELLGELSGIDGDISRALGQIRGGDDFELGVLDSGCWANELCSMPSGAAADEPEETSIFVSGKDESSDFTTVRVKAAGRMVEMLKAPLNRQQCDCVDGCDFSRRAKLTDREVDWDYPIDSVGFFDALWYCNSLSLVCGLTPCYSVGGSTDPKDWGEIPRPYWEAKFPPDFTAPQEEKFRGAKFNPRANGWRLPTREEWLSCAGTLPEDEEELGEVAVYKGNSDGDSLETARKDANALGLHDMYGLVWEWVWTEADGHGNRLILGGSWKDGAEQLSRECWRNPKYPLDTIGFRICRNSGTAVPDYISADFPAGSFADDAERSRRAFDALKDF